MDNPPFISPRLRAFEAMVYRRPQMRVRDETTAPFRLGADSLNYETLFVSQLPLIEEVVDRVCRRQRLAAAEAEEFASEVNAHIVGNDYEVLRRFQGRSTLRTYLIVVIQRLFLDYRTQKWGKWRPSADAKRLGPVALLLERLIARDGWSFEQAVELLKTNHSISETYEELEALYVKLAPRATKRQFVSVEAASDIAGVSHAPDAGLIEAEHDHARDRINSAVVRARQELTPEERLIVKMRFDDAFQVSQIAAALRLDQKRLYRTLDRILAQLRLKLVAEGISGEDVTNLFAEVSRG